MCEILSNVTFESWSHIALPFLDYNCNNQWQNGTRDYIFSGKNDVGKKYNKKAVRKRFWKICKSEFTKVKGISKGYSTEDLYILNLLLLKAILDALHVIFLFYGKKKLGNRFLLPLWAYSLTFLVPYPVVTPKGTVAFFYIYLSVPLSVSLFHFGFPYFFRYACVDSFQTSNVV